MLLDLDPEIILCCLEYLPASGQARARRACKLLYVIVDEIQRTTTFMVGGLGPLGSVIKSDLEPHIEAQPTMGILFSKEELSKADLTGLAAQLPHHLELVGGHMSVVVGTDAAGALVQSNNVCPHARGASAANTVGLTLGRFPLANVRSFAVDARARDGKTEQLRAEGALEPGWKVFVVIARDRDPNGIVEALQQAHPAAAIIGGIATGDTLYRSRKGAVQLIEEGVVGLMFSGDVPLAAFVSRGARGLGESAFRFGPADVDDYVHKDRDTPMGEPGQILTHVTKADGARSTALEATMEVLREAGQGGGFSLGLADGDGTDGFQLHDLHNDMVVPSREALRLPPRGETTYESGAVRFYTFDAASCKADLTKRLTEVKAMADSKGERVLGAVMFTCGGRTHRFFGEPAFDASTFTKIFEGTPLIGMYAGGEIGPPLLAGAPPAKAFQAGGAALHGFTAIFGLFIVPPRQPRASALAFADAYDAAVSAAFAELRSRAEPVPPQSDAAGASGVPSRLSELRALSVRKLKEAMGSLGLAPTPGSEKEDLVREIASHLTDGEPVE